MCKTHVFGLETAGTRKETILTRPYFLTVMVMRPKLAWLPSLLLAAVSLSAQDPEASVAIAAPLGEERVIVDGRLDEPVWASAPAVSRFVQRQPVEGAPASEPTEVRFLFSSRALYVGARMTMSEPQLIQAPVSRRDNPDQADFISISFDTFLDRRTSYTFGVTAAGTRFDHHHPTDRESSVDATFEPVWRAAVQRTATGWTAEMEIPWSQLRFNRSDELVFGLNIRRSIPSRNEEAYWIMVPRQEVGWASRFGRLTGMRGIETTRRIELLPYAAQSASFVGQVDPSDPFASDRRDQTRIGGDVKIGLGPNFTLEGTLNPDFGHVEADPAVINLSAFETIFPERRPFFTEGASLLRGGGPTWFYSRRIGQQPRVPVPGEFADYPETASILGAAKLTGRLPAGTSLGGLFAVTDRETATTWSAGDGYEMHLVSPRTAYGVMRLQQEIGASSSTIGLSLTATERDLDAGDHVSSFLPRSSYAGGLDWNLRLGGGVYEVAGYVGGSNVEGEAPAILRLQRSSARYYQRPDASHVEIDPTRRSLSGYTSWLSIEKVEGEHWLWQVYASTRSPGFEINDLGVMSRVDQTFGLANLRYRETEPRGVVRDYEIGLSSENAWNHDGTRTFAALRSDSSVTWKNFWSTLFTTWFDFRSRSDTATRGGPLMGTAQAWVVTLTTSNSTASPTRWSLGVFHGKNELGENTSELRGRLSFRPKPRWQFSADPAWYHATAPRQYVTTIPGGRDETYGQRYIFSFIDRSELALRLRLNYALTPDLSVELFAEPFAATGRYYRHGELLEPGKSALLFYGEDGTTATRGEDGSLHVTTPGGAFTLRSHDYDVRSFRSNAVVRWEWRPGSTAYLVWQQNREGVSSRVRSVGPGSLADPFDFAADDVLMLKISYWIPLDRLRQGFF
jgi:hypothetical protein